jgi:hypothetical protein
MDCPHYFEARSESDIRERLRKYAAATVLGLGVPPLAGVWRHRVAGIRGRFRLTLGGVFEAPDRRQMGGLLAALSTPDQPQAGTEWPGWQDWAMPARISCVCIDGVEPRPVADFWAAVLGWEVVEDGDERISLPSPGGDVPTLDIVPVPEGKQMNSRLCLDLRADGTSFEAEVDRLEGLVARRVDVGQGLGWDVGGVRRPGKATSSAFSAVPCMRCSQRRPDGWPHPAVSSWLGVRCRRPSG